jgi:pantoate--beta-alanine ligase
MAPIIAATVAEIRQVLAAAHRRGQTIGLVPTMGALHVGHASLIKAARAECDHVVVSIFVNPTQFGPNEDLARYPRPFERDVQVCADEGVDLIFHPSPDIMYPAPYRTYVEVEDMQDLLCGKSRPGHFRGVATVVLKLFNIVQPDRAYFGQKDAQQARLLMQMVEDLNVPVQIKLCPIVREPDGLALSSRNVYLDAEQRTNATVLVHSLEAVKQAIAAGERRTEPLLQRARGMIETTPGARVDYVAIVDFADLRPLGELRGRVLIALAVFFGTTRLIDNLLVEIG